MSDTVKLIIEIPKETYLEIKSGFITRSALESAIAIKDGTPLDDVIEELKRANRTYPYTNRGILEAIVILNKRIGEGSEG